MAFAAATLIVGATAVRLAAVAPLRNALDRVLAGAICASAQIVVSLLLAGALLQALDEEAVLATNAVLAVAAFAATWRQGFSLPAWRRPNLGAVRPAVSRHPWVAALVAVAALALLWRLVIAYALPPYTYDTLGYHLPTVAGWIQYGEIGLRHLHIYSASFPLNVEVFFAWVALLLHSDVLVGAVQIPFAVVGALAVAGTARLAGVRPPAATAAGALFALSPIVLTQSSTNYVDLTVTSLFLAGLYFVLRAMPSAVWDPPAGPIARVGPSASSWSRTYLVLAGTATGLAVGAKAVGPLLGLTVVVAFVAGAVVAKRRLGETRRWRSDVLRLLGFILVPLVGLGAFWFIRNWVVYDNPVYPGRVRLLGSTLFHGPGVGLSRLPSGAGISAIVHSWGYDVTRVFNASTGKYDRVDEFEGGLGLVWLLLGLPLLIPFVVSAWRRNRALVWTFLAPLAFLFAIQPYRWWSRFTMYLLAPTLIALVAFVDRTTHRGARRAVEGTSLALVAVGLWFSSSHMIGWGHSYGIDQVAKLATKPEDQRTLGRLFLPELRWVDHVESHARIAVNLHADILRDRFPPYYALYGRRFEHHVFLLPAASRAATFAWLRRERIGYVYLGRSSAAELWLRAEPARFSLLFADRRVAAYAVTESAGRAAS